MKVVRCNSPFTDVASIKVGESFEYIETLYLRISSPFELNNIPCVNLKSGQYKEFSSDVQVQRVKYMVVPEDYVSTITGKSEAYLDELNRTPKF